MAFAQTLELFSRKRGTYTWGPSESIMACRLFRKGVHVMSDFMMKRPLYGLLAGAALMTACASAPQAEPPISSPDSGASGPAVETPTVPSLPPFPASGHAGMDAWRQDFASRSRSPQVAIQPSFMRPCARSPRSIFISLKMCQSPEPMSLIRLNLPNRFGIM